MKKLFVSILMACATPALAHAAQPPDPALLKQCESAKGEVKEECKKVANKMMKDPQAQQERDDKTGQDVTHSSPVMDAEAPDKHNDTQSSDKQSKPAQSKPAQSKPTRSSPPKSEARPDASKQ